MPGLRIGINALYLLPGGVGGTEVYLRNLLGALAGLGTSHRYFVIVNRETGGALAPRAAGFEHVESGVRAARRPRRILWEQLRLPGLVRRLRLDVLLNPGFTAPVLCPCPQVSVMHDLQHLRHPEYFRWFDLPFWRLLVWASAHRSGALIAISEATRADLLRYYRLPAARVHQVDLGVEQAYFELASQRDPAPYLLYVSTLHPHKNHVRLLRAFARLRQRHPELRLVLAGMRGFATTEVLRAIEALGIGDAVEVTGWIPHERLLELYRRAAACVFPSLFEGFGMGVLEALAAGIPLACSAIEPLAGIAGDAALTFPPTSDEALYDALVRLVEDEPLRTRLAAAGPARAARYSWSETARRTLAVLKAVAQRR